MIDWPDILSHFPWILGLAVLLATLSFAHWQAGQTGRAFRQSLLQPSFRLLVHISLILFTLGLALAVEPRWQKIGWAGLAALSSWNTITAWRDGSGKTG